MLCGDRRTATARAAASSSPVTLVDEILTHEYGIGDRAHRAGLIARILGRQPSLVQSGVRGLELGLDSEVREVISLAVAVLYRRSPQAFASALSDVRQPPCTTDAEQLRVSSGAELKAQEILTDAVWDLDHCVAGLWGARNALTGRGAGRKPLWNYSKGAEQSHDERHYLIAQHRSTCSASAVAWMITGNSNRTAEVQRGGLHAAFCAALRGETVHPAWLACHANKRCRDLWIPAAEQCALFAALLRKLTAKIDEHIDEAVLRIRRGDFEEKVVLENKDSILLRTLSVMRGVGSPSAAAEFFRSFRRLWKEPRSLVTLRQLHSCQV